MNSSEKPYHMGGNQHDYPSEEKIYKRSKFPRGCFSFIFILPIVIGIIAIYFYVYPMLTPNSVSGDFLNMTYVEDENGKGIFWLLTDGSFNFTSERKSPGSYSMSRECYFCKTWTYMVDAETKSVINKFKTEFDDVIILSYMATAGTKVWVVTGAYGENEARVYAYNGTTGEMLMNTESFIAKYPELSSGLVKIRLEYKPDKIVMDTKDGYKGIIIALDDEKLYHSYSDFKKRTDKNNDKEISRFILGSANGSEQRMKLYKVTGPTNEISEEKSFNVSYLENAETMMYFHKSKSELLTPEKVYINGLIFDDDEDGVIILHQDNAGKTANRMVTLVNKYGTEKWTIPQEELFEEMKVNENEDPFSKIFFMKDKIKIKRYGSKVLVILQEWGAIVFDYETGKKVMEFTD